MLVIEEIILSYKSNQFFFIIWQYKFEFWVSKKMSIINFTNTQNWMVFDYIFFIGKTCCFIMNFKVHMKPTPASPYCTQPQLLGIWSNSDFYIKK